MSVLKITSQVRSGSSSLRSVDDHAIVAQRQTVFGRKEAA
jgi:hypothetical protein